MLHLNTLNLGLVMLFAWHSTTGHGAEAKKKKFSGNRENSAITDSMAELSRGLAQLMPYATASDHSNFIKNKTQIIENLSILKKYAHEISSEQKEYPEYEPLIKFISQSPMQDSLLAIALVKKDELIPAQHIINLLTGNCISCHTRKKSKFYYGTLNIPTGFEKFSALEKAEYFAAAKQFTDAIKYYETVLSDGALANRDPVTWSNAVKRLLAIIVRVKQNPSLAMELLSRFRDLKSMPKGFEATISIWRQSTKEWRDSGRAGRLDRKSKFIKAGNLMKEAENLQQKHRNISDADFIQKLRAANFLHEILSEAPYDKIFAEALYEAALVSESLRNFNFWTSAEAYYEACVRFQPNSPLAHKCFPGYMRTQQDLIMSPSKKMQEFSHIWVKINELRKLSGF